MKNTAILLFSLFSLVSFGQTKRPKIIKEKKVKVVEIKSGYDSDNSIAPVGESPYQTEDENKIYQASSVMTLPDFPGGIKAFSSYITKNIVISDEMKSEKIRGKVIASFVVEKDGSTTDIKILREVGFGTGNEALRVLKNMPKWLPAELNGKKVRCNYNIPILFDATN